VEDLPTAKVKIDADDAIAKFRTELEEVPAIKLKFDLTHLNAELQNEIAGIKVNADLSEFANNISSSVKDQSTIPSDQVSTHKPQPFLPLITALSTLGCLDFGFINLNLPLSYSLNENLASEPSFS
jgi:hypothetical protein